MSDGTAKSAWQAAAANVEHQTVDLNHMNLAPGEPGRDPARQGVSRSVLDESGKVKWPKIDTRGVLASWPRVETRRSLIVVDHSAKAGSGPLPHRRLHRIDEAYAIKDIESQGFKVAAKATCCEGRTMRATR